MRGERSEQGSSLQDPGVVGACPDTWFVRRPADTADQLCELALTAADGLPLRRAGARAVDRYERRLSLHDDLDYLLVVQVTFQDQDPVIIDDRHVEALPLPAHVNAHPHSHVSKPAPGVHRPHPLAA